jgi:hypothetical protein
LSDEKVASISPSTASVCFTRRAWSTRSRVFAMTTHPKAATARTTRIATGTIRRKLARGGAAATVGEYCINRPGAAIRRPAPISCAGVCGLSVSGLRRAVVA